MLQPHKTVHSKLKILHLEDLKSDADLVRIQLKRQITDLEILVVDNKADFMEGLKNFDPDIILADHTLPSFNSLEALTILKETGKKIPFILITATVSEEYAIQVMRAGASDYILKDRPQRLHEAMLSAIEKYRLESEREIFLKKIIISEANLISKNNQLIQFNQIVAHDLRTPVSNIMLMANIINEIKDNAEKEILFSNLKRIASKINETLDVLVDVAKINEDANIYTENLFFKDAFDNIYSSLTIIARQLGSKFNTNFTACPTIHYSKIYLESIFSNLMTNSLKYYSPERSPVISIISYKQNKNIIMEYEDNGLGLDMKKNGEKIFGINQTFHKNKDRKGLGLFMIKNQIQASGGSIQAESEENKGIRFIIKFAA
ncbi:MAG: HAMP domain-containing sensor histidine kinase [Parafilimonas sp.]